MRRFLVILLFLAAATACADTFRVQVRTVDGSEIQGTAELETFHVESDLGKFDISPADTRLIEITGGQATLQLRDGSRINGTINLKSLKVASKLGEVTLAVEKIKQIVVQEKEVAKPPVGPGAPPASEADPTASAELKPEASGADTTSLAGRPRMAADGSCIYELHPADSRFCAVDPKSLAISKSVNVTPGLTRFSISPDGTKAFLVGGSTVSVLDLGTFEVKKSFQVEHKLTDVLTVDGKLALATSSAGLVVLDPDKQAALAPRKGIGGAMTYIPGQNRCYVSGGSFTWEVAPGQPGGVRIRISSQGSGNGDSTFNLTRDGRFGVTPEGGLYRLGKSSVAAFLPAGRLSPNTSMVGLKDKILLLNQEGFLKVHDAATFELTKSVQLGIAAWEAIVDEKGGALYLFASPSGTARRPVSKETGATAMGRWYRYRIP